MAQQVAKFYSSKAADYLQYTIGCQLFKDSTPGYIAAVEDAVNYLDKKEYYLAEPIYPVFDDKGVETIGMPIPKPKPKDK